MGGINKNKRNKKLNNNNQLKKTNDMKKVTFFAPNQCYFYSDGQIVFQSYDTIVARINETTNEVVITDGQPQSKTTAKYLNQFLNELIGVNDYKKL